MIISKCHHTQLRPRTNTTSHNPAYLIRGCSCGSASLVGCSEFHSYHAVLAYPAHRFAEAKHRVFSLLGSGLSYLRTRRWHWPDVYRPEVDQSPSKRNRRSRTVTVKTAEEILVVIEPFLTLKRSKNGGRVEKHDGECVILRIADFR